VVARKSSPAEPEAYRNVFASVVEQAAQASKRDSLLGFGGVRVSNKQLALITVVKTAAGVA